MPKTKGFRQGEEPKSIKNIYIKKINSLFKVTGDSQTPLACMSNVRRTISSVNREEWLLQRRENNKDAARKARQRKKVYMELLQQAVEDLQKLNQEGEELLKNSGKLLLELSNETKCAKEDEIDQYLMPIQNEKEMKDCSLATMDLQKECELNKIVTEIQKMAIPFKPQLQNLETLKFGLPQNRQISKMTSISSQLPEIFQELKNVCSDHASLHVLSHSSKNDAFVDPYTGKTLMEEFYSSTLCRKDVENVEVSKFVDFLSLLDRHCCRVEKSLQ